MHKYTLSAIFRSEADIIDILTRYIVVHRSRPRCVLVLTDTRCHMPPPYPLFCQVFVQQDNPSFIQESSSACPWLNIQGDIQAFDQDDLMLCADDNVIGDWVLQ